MKFQTEWTNFPQKLKVPGLLIPLYYAVLIGREPCSHINRWHAMNHRESSLNILRHCICFRLELFSRVNCAFNYRSPIFSHSVSPYLIGPRVQPISADKQQFLLNSQATGEREENNFSCVWCSLPCFVREPESQSFMQAHIQTHLEIAHKFWWDLCCYWGEKISKPDRRQRRRD